MFCEDCMSTASLCMTVLCCIVDNEVRGGLLHYRISSLIASAAQQLVRPSVNELALACDRLVRRTSHGAHSQSGRSCSGCGYASCSALSATCLCFLCIKYIMALGDVCWYSYILPTSCHTFMLFEMSTIKSGSESSAQ